MNNDNNKNKILNKLFFLVLFVMISDVWAKLGRIACDDTALYTVKSRCLAHAFRYRPKALPLEKMLERTHFMLDFKKSLDLCFDQQPHSRQQFLATPNTQTLAWIEIALQNVPNIVDKQTDTLAAYRDLPSPEEKLNFLTTIRDNGVVVLDGIIQQISKFLHHEGSDHRKKQIREIITNEVRNKNNIVVYRSSTPQHKCLVDLYSNIVSLVRMNSSAQAHRLFVDPHRNLSKFYQEFNQSNQSDNNYRNFGLYGTSGSLSALDASLYESAMFFWWDDIGCVHTDHRGHFESLLQLMRVSKNSQKYKQAHLIIDEMLELSEEFGSCMNQIFIDPNVVDDLLWVATPFGKKRSAEHSTQNLIESVLRFPQEFVHEGWKKMAIFDHFQARVYLADLRFYDPKFVKTDFYYVNPLNPERFNRYKTLRKKLTQLLLENYLTTHKCMTKKEYGEILINKSTSSKNSRVLRLEGTFLQKLYKTKHSESFLKDIDRSLKNIQNFFVNYKIWIKQSKIKKRALQLIQDVYTKMKKFNSSSVRYYFGIFKKLGSDLERLLLSKT